MLLSQPAFSSSRPPHSRRSTYMQRLHLNIFVRAVYRLSGSVRPRSNRRRLASLAGRRCQENDVNVCIVQVRNFGLGAECLGTNPHVRTPNSCACAEKLGLRVMP